jgi:hypothetical protein
MPISLGPPNMGGQGLALHSLQARVIQPGGLILNGTVPQRTMGAVQERLQDGLTVFCLKLTGFSRWLSQTNRSTRLLGDNSHFFTFGPISLFR